MGKIAIGIGFTIFIILIIAIASGLSSSSENSRMEDEQKVRELKAQYEKNPTFANKYAWYKESDSYRYWYADDEDTDQAEKLLINYVQNYNGQNKGTDTVLDIIKLTVLLSGIDLNHPSTSLGWYVLGTTITQNSIIDNSQTVIFSYETYDQEGEAQFWVNVKTGDITYGNELAKEILKNCRNTLIFLFLIFLNSFFIICLECT